MQSCKKYKSAQNVNYMIVILDKIIGNKEWGHLGGLITREKEGDDDDTTDTPKVRAELNGQRIGKIL